LGLDKSILFRFFIYLFFICISGIDPPESDPLYDVNLRLGWLSYGANLATAVLFVQTDAEINRRNEDCFQISGIFVEGGAPYGRFTQKAAGQKILTDLIATWYPVSARPRILSVYLPRRFVPPGPNVLPPLIFIFTDSDVAAQIRAKLVSHFRSSPLPAMRRVWMEPVLTKATLVRIDILLAIKRALSGVDVRCTLLRLGR
jgi:hypothetical protein